MTEPVANENAQASDERWCSGGRFGLLLFALLLASFFPVLLGERAWFYRDYGFLGYPFAFHNQQALLSGSIPHWNPYIHCGVPHFAQWNTMVLYPGSLICVLFPLPWSLAWFCALHLWLGGVGMWRLGRDLTGSEFAGAFGGVAFAFGGLALGAVIYPNYLVALGWMPWLYLLVRRAWREGGRWIAWAAGAGAMQMLSGAPELILLTWLLFAVGLAAEFGLNRELVQPAGRFAAVVALVAGLSAIQLLPFFRLLAMSQRTASAGSVFWSLPPMGWLNFVTPLAGSFQTPQGVFVQIGQSFLPSVYLGAPVVALALAGGWSDRRRRVGLIEAGFGLFCVLLALGGGFVVWRLVSALVPIGFARFPVKAVLPLAFLVPLFAMRGVRAEEGRAKAQWMAVAIVALLIVAGTANTLFNNPVPIDGRAVLMNGLARLLLTGGAVYLVIRRVSLKGRARSVASLVALLILWADGLWHLPVLNPTVSVSTFQPGLMRAFHERELGSELPHSGQGRIMLSPRAERELHTRMVPDFEGDFLGQRLALWGNLNLLDGIPKVNGAATLMTSWARDVEVFLYSNTNRVAKPLMDFLGVTHVTATNELLKLRPRAGGMPLVSGGQATRAGAMELGDAAWDPRREVFVEGINRAAAEVTIEGLVYRAGRIEFVAQSSGPSVAVIAESWDPNWTARINGAVEKVRRANHAFMAVPLPEGESRVVLEFKDRSFAAGTAISLASLALCLGIVFRAGRNQRSSEKKNSE